MKNFKERGIIMGPYDEDIYESQDDYVDDTMEDLIASEYTYGDGDFSDGIDTDMDSEDDYL